MESQEGSTSRWWTPFCLHADDTGVDFGCAPEAGAGVGHGGILLTLLLKAKYRKKGTSLVVQWRSEERRVGKECS